MSWKGVRLAYEHSGLPAASKAVLVAIGYRCNLNTGDCHPSIAQLMDDTGLSRRWVQNAIRKLEAENVISVSRSNGGRNRAHRYRINGAQSARFNDEKGRTECTVSETETVHDSTLNGALDDPKQRTECTRNRLNRYNRQPEDQKTSLTRSEEHDKAAREKLAKIRSAIR